MDLSLITESILGRTQGPSEVGRRVGVGGAARLSHRQGLPSAGQGGTAQNGRMGRRVRTSSV